MYSKVKLINPQPGSTEEQDLIAFCARVSNPGNQNNTKTAAKLTKFLIKNKHWSPLEMVNACVEIETTRDIARQILRHRSFHYQEFSQRYADPTKELDFVLREARLQDAKNRQNSIETDDESLQIAWNIRQKEVIRAAESAYKWAIENGIAKEQSRCVLPEGNTMSRMYMNGTLRSWIHYIALREDPATQKEHRDVATKVRQELVKVFPIIDEVSEWLQDQESQTEKSITVTTEKPGATRTTTDLLTQFQ